jgi:hypothetical protein
MRPILFAILIVSPVLAADPVMDGFRATYKTAKLNLMETAQVMPESDYGFKLSPAQRPFAGWIEHTAGMNLRACSAMAGKPAPDTTNLAALKAKPELIKAFEESFVYCDSIINAMSDTQATTEVTVGGKKAVPVAGMFAYVSNLNEHYGNLVGYMRAKGVTPPSTARSQKK